MFAELGRIIAVARIEIDQRSGTNSGEDTIPKWIVVGLLNRIESQVGLTERQVFESLSSNGSKIRGEPELSDTPSESFEMRTLNVVHKRIDELQPGEIVIRGSCFVVGTVKKDCSYPQTHTEVIDKKTCLSQLNCKNDHLLTVVTPEMSKSSNEALLNAAIEAVEHMSQAGWQERDTAARTWLNKVFNGDTKMTLDEIQKEINEE